MHDDATPNVPTPEPTDDETVLEHYPVPAELWRPVNEAFVAMCRAHGLDKGYQAVSFDRTSGSFVIHERPDPMADDAAPAEAPKPKVNGKSKKAKR